MPKPYALRRETAVAFTLIELLIVVAIIAILAAIAVPNFLEAQTRAKVSRAKADMRSIATALESYRVDGSTYPTSFVEPPLAPAYNLSNFRYSWGALITTPVAYMTSLPKDSFLGQAGVGPEDLRTLFDYRRTVEATTGEPRTNPPVGKLTLLGLADASYTGVGDIDGTNLRPTGWVIYSPGPDKFQNINSHQLAAGGTARGFGDPLGLWTVYDSTNGTVSAGDVIRSTYGDEKAITSR